MFVPEIVSESVSYSADATARVLSWRNQAEGVIDIPFRRISSEFAFASLALVAVVEGLVRPIFAILATITSSCGDVKHHYSGFKRSVFTVMNSPFLLIENLFISRVSLVGI
jgi:hypothetical protein